MTETEKAIIDFCGHYADWWPSTTQVQEMLALAQPERSMKVEGPLHVVCQCNKCNTQPEQEPVGQLLEDAFGRGQVMWFNKPKDESMLYTTTPQRKPQIWEHEGYDALCQELELWKAEAQRKPLTDEEIQNILPDDGTPMSLGEAFVKFARAIEAAHGIKGEA